MLGLGSLEKKQLQKVTDSISELKKILESNGITIDDETRVTFNDSNIYLYLRVKEPNIDEKTETLERDLYQWWGLQKRNVGKFRVNEITPFDKYGGYKFREHHIRLSDLIKARDESIAKDFNQLDKETQPSRSPITSIVAEGSSKYAPRTGAASKSVKGGNYARCNFKG